MTTPRKRAPGGGRKPLNPAQPTRRITVALDAAQYDKATALGDGNVAKGVRKALDASAG